MEQKIQELLDEFIPEIKNQDLVAFLLVFFEQVPTDNLKRATSSSGKYHLTDENGEWGNLIHTRRVTRMCIRLADIHDLKDEDKDKLICGGLLHDSYKYGELGTEKWTTKEHPITAADKIEEFITDYTTQKTEDLRTIATIVREHTGRWSSWPLTNHPLGKLLHIADAIEADLPKIL